MSLHCCRRILKLDPKHIGGLKHAISVSSPDVDLADIAEDKSSLILRLNSKTEVANSDPHSRPYSQYLSRSLM